MIVCPACGGNLRFDIASQKMHCKYCETYIEPKDVVEKERDANLQKDSDPNVFDNSDDMEVTVYTCPQCGAELMSSDSDATSFCSFCGAANILTERIAHAKRPDDIIPFKITKEECKKKYAARLSKAIFAPKALKNADYIDSFRGIYMPYWSYDVSQEGRAHLDGTTSERDGDYKLIHHFDLSMMLNNKYEGISHDSSESFDDNISESLAPYNTDDKLNFSSAYLSGFYADIADVEPLEYMEEAKRIAAEDVCNRLSREERFREYSIEKDDTEKLIRNTCTKVSNVKRSMFPVWFLSYRSKDNRVAYAAINGQTGKVCADIPIDKVKYLIASALLSIVIWIFLCMFDTSSLLQILRNGILGGTIALMIDGYILAEVDAKEESLAGNKNEDDINKRENASKKDFRETKEDKDKKKKIKGKSKSEKKNESDRTFNIVANLVGIILMLLGFWLEAGFFIIAIPIIVAFFLFANIVGMKDNNNRGLISGGVLLAIIVVSSIIWNADPAADAWYYIPQVLITVSAVWTFFDVLYYYNRLMTRPMPQFKKSGGDDNA